VQFTDQSTPTGQISTWLWSFGDDGTSDQQNPSHPYAAIDSYMVTLTVTGPGGSDSRTEQVTVREPGEVTRKRGGAGGPCFVATAAYGTPMADQLDVLRAFRDRYLLTNAFGSSLVRTYYRYSPVIADVVAGNYLLRAVTRGILAPIVAVVRLLLSTPPSIKVATALAGIVVCVASLIRRKATE